MKHQHRERGVAVLITATMLVLAIPMIGLTFDGTMLFIFKARLQGAVDGAVLAGARALSRGNDSASQLAAAGSEARAFVKLNFPDGYFSSTITVDDPVFDLSVANQRKITMVAHATAPALLMRFLQFNATTINASATAVRRDVNVMMVVDRSGSLQASGSCGPLQQAAINFSNKFANGRDNLGLVTFASSTFVNFPIGTNFKSASPNIATLIGSFACAGSTSSAVGLWSGYDQLVGLNQTGALNIILFFTDGQPTGVAVDMPLTNASPCTNPFSPGPPRTVRGLYNTFTNVNQFFGVLRHDGIANPDGTQKIQNGDIVPSQYSAGCTFMNGWSNNGGVNNMTNTSDFLGVPTVDIFGNSLDTSYQFVSKANGWIDLANNNNAAAMALNAADSAAQRIRAAAIDPAYNRGLSGIVTFSIGLGNAAIPASPVFLQRVSNDPGCAGCYDSSKPAGQYIPAPSAADIDAAFGKVASEILRLAK